MKNLDQTQFEDVEEVERNPKINNRALKLQVNEETLTTVLQELRNHLKDHKDLINELDSKISKRTTERLIGDYFERIVKVVNVKDLNEKLSKFKLADPVFQAGDNPNEDSQHLKLQVEQFILTLEAIMQ